MHGRPCNMVWRRAAGPAWGKRVSAGLRASSAPAAECGAAFGGKPSREYGASAMAGLPTQMGIEKPIPARYSMSQPVLCSAVPLRYRVTG